MDHDVDLDDIRAARSVIADVAKHTPVISSLTLSAGIGGNIVLKAENLQRTGAFKIRGATNKVASLGSTASLGVTTGSAGNHAQALAFAAQYFGVPCMLDRTLVRPRHIGQAAVRRIDDQADQG